MEFTDKDTGVTLKANTAAGERFLNEFLAIRTNMKAQEAEWIADLRARKVKAAHPDDGGVNREQNSVVLTYPQFFDHPEEGDVIALGVPGKFRLVRVGLIRNSLLGLVHYHFVELPPAAPGRGLGAFFSLDCISTRTLNGSLFRSSARVTFLTLGITM